MVKSNLIGQQFGHLTVMEQVDNSEDRYLLWRCRCDCGGEILVNTKRLKRNTINNCGCIPKTNSRRGPVAEDLTGQQFGLLTALYKTQSNNKRTMWRCRCECGREKDVSACGLKSSKIKSCGCLQYVKGRNITDISGQTFGRLTALYPTERRSVKASVYWHCRCECGTELDVAYDRLAYGNNRSCGCLKRENQEAIYEKLNLIDGTCVEWLEKRKHRSDNTSGFRGVNKMKNGNYRVSIGFKRTRYHVGTYRSYQDAVRARIEAEETIHGGFLRQYYAWKERAEQDPEWGASHPLKFEVVKDEGLCIKTPDYELNQLNHSEISADSGTDYQTDTQLTSLAFSPGNSSDFAPVNSNT